MIGKLTLIGNRAVAANQAPALMLAAMVAAPSNPARHPRRKSATTIAAPASNAVEREARTALQTACVSRWSGTWFTASTSRRILSTE